MQNGVHFGGGNHLTSIATASGIGVRIASDVSVFFNEESFDGSTTIKTKIRVGT